MADLNDYLQLKTERLVQLRERMADPNAAPAALSVTCRVAGASGVRPVQVRQFTFVTDSSPALAGYDLGPTAPELLLSSLASCLAHTFLIVASNRGVTYRALEVRVDGEIDFRGILEVTDAPTSPHRLHYTAAIDCDLDEPTLAAIQQDVERLCPVLQAIVNPLTVQGTIVRTEG
jgi:uncharacterized OsmC-like protein